MEFSDSVYIIHTRNIEKAHIYTFSAIILNL